MMRLLSLSCFVTLSLVTVARADEAEQYQQIRTLLQTGKLSEAEEVFQEAIKENPDSLRIKSLHYLLYAYNERDKNYPVAIGHLEAHIDSNLLPSDTNPKGNLSSLPLFADRLLTCYENAGKQKEGSEKLDKLLERVESVLADDNTYSQIAVRELRNRKLLLQAQMGQQDQARISLDTRLAAAEEAVAKKPADSAALLDLVFLLKGDGELAAETGSDEAEAKKEQFLERLMASATEHPDNAPLVIAALGEQLSAIGGMARKEPFKAETMLEQLKALSESLSESENAEVKSRLSSIDRSLPSLQRAIESGKFHAELIGKDAYPLIAEAWVNGEPLSESDLKGKVVLLDFWAVWCGPCIATFPHLREWQEKYEDKGLVIVGVTRYYNYGWNEETSRPQKAEEELPPEDEQAAMVKFAEHYDLKHRFMVTPKDSALQKDYGVSGIPQAVLIDREGKIRLIRVGSGDANAEEIDKLLVELIGDGN